MLFVYLRMRCVVYHNVRDVCVFVFCISYVVVDIWCMLFDTLRVLRVGVVYCRLSVVVRHFLVRRSLYIVRPLLYAMHCYVCVSITQHAIYTTHDV